MFCVNVKRDQDPAEWLVYNEGTDLEFAECSACGYEVDRVVQLVLDDKYARCPGCGRKMRGNLRHVTD